MSNQVCVVRTKFEDLHSGEVSFGVRVYDDYGSTYVNTFESMPKDDKELITEILCNNHEIADMFDSIKSCRKCLTIDNKVYDWEEIEDWF